MLNHFMESDLENASTLKNQENDAIKKEILSGKSFPIHWLWKRILSLDTGLRRYLVQLVVVFLNSLFIRMCIHYLGKIP